MLRIEEIAGAMDDDFRDALADMDSARLETLRADKRALDRLRPVGVSHGEAVSMIEAILAARTAPPRLSGRRKLALVLREAFRRLAHSD